MTYDDGATFPVVVWDELLPEKFGSISCLQLCIEIMTMKSFLFSYIICIDNIVQGSSWQE